VTVVAQTASTGPRVSDRLASAFLLVLMSVGCLVLWIGIPIGCLWLAAKWSDSNAEHFLYVLPMVLVGMAVFAKFLFWLNRLYVRVTLGAHAVEADAEADEWDEPRWVRGPLETLLVGSLVIAIIALFAWFFLLAENPSMQVI
jgi:hypothetical protein